MVDIRKIVIIFVIAVLFSILVFALIDAVYPHPEYEDFCGKEMYPRAPLDKVDTCADVATFQENQECSESEGFIRYTEFNESGCPTAFECDTCQKDYDAEQENYNFWVFMISALTALIAIAIGLYLPTDNMLNEWVGTGFMLGGLFVLFFSTARSYDDLDRLLRPIVILIELVIVLYISYKKLNKK